MIEILIKMRGTLEDLCDQLKQSSSTDQLSNEDIISLLVSAREDIGQAVTMLKEEDS